MDHVHQTFLAYDRDHSGTMDVSELQSALLELGLPANTTEAMKILRKYNVDRSGTLSLAEFRQLAHEVRKFVSGKPKPLSRWPVSPPTPKPQRKLIEHASYPLKPATYPDIDPRPMPPPKRANFKQQSAQQERQEQRVARMRPITDENQPQPQYNRPQLEPVRLAAPVASRAKAKLEVLASNSREDDGIDSAFHKADTDGNGRIDARELISAMTTLGISPDNLDQAVETMRRYDRDGDGALQRDEFRVLAQDVMRWRAAAK